MPVSKSKRRKKRSSQQPSRPASHYDFSGKPDPMDFSRTELDAALDAELDTEAAIAELKQAGKGFRTPTLATAEQMVMLAWQADDPYRHIDLVTKALKLCPWCADAYGSLALAAKKHPRMALHLRRLALAAAEFALDADWGQDLRQAYAENYWSHVATRAYMRARSGLAETLADAGALEEAVDHLEELLKLNPNDDQGLRYPLAEHLLLLGRDERLLELIEECAGEASAFVGFNGALLAFREGGDCPESRMVLAAARQANPHVVGYLLGDRAPPPATMKIYEPGGDDEAALYVACTAEAWRASEGALDWLRRYASGKP